MSSTEIDDLKRVHRGTWAAGDYASVADRITEPVAPLVVERAGITAGQDVLDVATGTGNAALHAAAAGAHATGLDLTPELFDTARSRAAAMGVEVEWVEGDAEQLPFGDASFDRVTSVFGVQFAPRHEVAAAELARVCRPGGMIVLANWTPQGAIGNLFKVLGGYMPKPPPYASPPPLWGSEEHVAALFAGTGVELETTRLTTPLDFDSADDYVSFMETQYGPTLKARERLSGEGTWDACRAEIVEMMDGRNEASGNTLSVPAEYLLLIGRKQG